ncbi:MAG: DUF6090 family protein, partial [Melioribacteraceae bacterium]|nr:DUF6090 family protein [Melioribacteraceae bacterium]
VVIGILIALQVNNWNENRKDRESERMILSEIRDNLLYDLNDFDDNIAHLKNRLISCQTLLHAIETNISYHDSLGFCFSYLSTFPHFSSKKNGYKLLQSKGIDLVVNDDLRNRITSLYDDRYQYLLTFEREQIDYIMLHLEDMMKPYFGNDELALNIIPKSFIKINSVQTLSKLGYFRNIRDYGKLKEDEDFHSMIKRVEVISAFLWTVHNSVKEETLELIQYIERVLQE